MRDLEEFQELYDHINYEIKQATQQDRFIVTINFDKSELDVVESVVESFRLNGYDISIDRVSDVIIVELY